MPNTVWDDKKKKKFKSFSLSLYLNSSRLKLTAFIKSIQLLMLND